MMTVLIFLLCTLQSEAQTAIGTDLSALLYKEIKIHIGHRIGRHWSISASAGANIQELRRHTDDETAGHEKEFPPSQTLPEAPYTHRESIGLCYWPQAPFSGTFLSFGGEYRSGTGLDATIGAGYMFSIWKGLTGTIRYDTGIIRIASMHKLSIQDLSIGINWIF